MINNTKKYRLSFLTFLKPGILPFIIFMLFIVVYIPLMVYTYKSEEQFWAWLVAFLWISFVGVPPLVLHINYFLNDKNKSIKINNSKKLIVLIKDNKEHIVNYNEIIKVEKYHSKNIGEAYVPKMNWHTYYYYKIILKNNEPFYISRMTFEKFESIIEGIDFQFIRVFYPLIPLNSPRL